MLDDVCWFEYFVYLSSTKPAIIQKKFNYIKMYTSMINYHYVKVPITRQHLQLLVRSSKNQMYLWWPIIDLSVSCICYTCKSAIIIKFDINVSYGRQCKWWFHGPNVLQGVLAKKRESMTTSGEIKRFKPSATRCFWQSCIWWKVMRI